MKFVISKIGNCPKPFAKKILVREAMQMQSFAPLKIQLRLRKLGRRH